MRTLPILPPGTKFEFWSGVLGIDHEMTIWDKGIAVGTITQIPKKDREAIAKHMVALWQEYGSRDGDEERTK